MQRKEDIKFINENKIKYSVKNHKSSNVYFYFKHIYCQTNTDNGSDNVRYLIWELQPKKVF